MGQVEISNSRGQTMVEKHLSLKSPKPEQRRIAASQYERANQVLSKGDFDYGIKLLLECCKLDPGNLIYRKTLRQAQKAKHKNNLKGSRLATLTTTPAKLKLNNALRSQDYLKVLELAEDILVHNPWDVGVQRALAQAFVAFEQYEGALWSLEQARQKAPKDLKVNRELARVYEKVGNFTAANALWEIIRKADPSDEEAWNKAKDLAARETIARGNYESVLNKETQESPSLQETEEHPSLDKNQPPTAPSNSRIAREEAAFRAKIETDPQDPLNYLQLSSLYRRQENWDKAREILEAGLQALGHNFEITLELTELAIQPFRTNLTHTENQLKENPDDEDLKKLRLKLVKEINSRELELFRKKADRFPTDMNFRLEVGIRLLQANQIDEAIQELQAARTDPRLHWRALMYLGFCFKTRKNWRLAQRNFEDALRNIPPSETTKRKEILYQLAQGMAESGDISAAIEWGYELANEDFGYKNIGNLLDQWQEKLQGSESY